jgi:hypothetical protein
VRYRQRIEKIVANSRRRRHLQRNLHK